MINNLFLGIQFLKSLLYGCQCDHPILTCYTKHKSILICNICHRKYKINNKSKAIFIIHNWNDIIWYHYRSNNFDGYWWENTNEEIPSLEYCENIIPEKYINLQEIILFTKLME